MQLGRKKKRQNWNKKERKEQKCNWLVSQFLQWARPVWDWNKFRCKVIIAPFCFATSFFDLVQIRILEWNTEELGCGSNKYFCATCPPTTSHSSAWCFSNQLKLFKAHRWSSNMTQCDWCDIDFWSKFKMLWLLNIEKKAFSPTPRVPAASVIRRCFSNLKYDQRWPIWSVPSVRILAPKTWEHFSCSLPFGWIDAFDWGNLLQKKTVKLAVSQSNIHKYVNPRVQESSAQLQLGSCHWDWAIVSLCAPSLLLVPPSLSSYPNITNAMRTLG